MKMNIKIGFSATLFAALLTVFAMNAQTSTTNTTSGKMASQNWVNYRIAEQETNTQLVVDEKIEVLLSTNGVSGAYVNMKIAQQETNTQIVVDDKINVASSNLMEQVNLIMNAKKTYTPSNVTIQCGNLTGVFNK